VEWEETVLKNRDRIKRYTPHWYFIWFRKFFPRLRGQDYIDTDLLLVHMKAILNPVKLDAKLHELHGQYENEGLNMKELITQEYGALAAQWVEVAIQPQEE